MRLGLPENQPVWFGTLLACFALVLGAGFLASGALAGFATLRWVNQEYLHFWSDTVNVAPLNEMGAIAFITVVGGGSSLAGIALVYCGVRDLRECYHIAERWLSSFTHR
jgi:hypothetical protein